MKQLKGIPAKLHRVEGAMFLWLWLKDCPVSNDILYARLKAKGVLIVSGHHFFPGLSAKDRRHWKHTKECLRITYSQQEELVFKGLDIIASEIRLAYESA
tara:strand:- start:1034 stop:1333 length:300 start_codon:yes stop_codon:yes gene_type:complete